MYMRRAVRNLLIEMSILPAAMSAYGPTLVVVSINREGNEDLKIRNPL